MSSNQKQKEKDKKNAKRFAFAIVIILLLAVLGLGIAAYVTMQTQLQSSSQLIQTLQSRTLQLEMETMELMMTQNMTFQTRYIQNGTVHFGLMKEPTTAAFDVAEYADFVLLDYQLKEVLLSPALISVFVLQLSATPRPVVFPGWATPVTNPTRNNLNVQIGLWSPPIDQLDSLAQNYNYLAYSFNTASKIKITPDCPTLGTCLPPYAENPSFVSDNPTKNAFYIFNAGFLGTSGFATLQFRYGQTTYSSIPAQYDFVGSQLELTDTIQLILPII